MGNKVSNVFAIVALFIIVVAGMRAAASIINPFLLAVFLSSLC
jgi:predicted PurR-regulated permease PerM